MTTPKRIQVGSPFDPQAHISIDLEGASYIATVMEEEFQRTKDNGALEITRRIREGLAG